MLLGIFLYNGTMFYELKNGTLVETKDAQGNFDLTQVLGNKYLEDVDSEKCVIVDTYSNRCFLISKDLLHHGVSEEVYHKMLDSDETDSNKSSEEVTFILTITYKCNMHCTYCYQQNDKTLEKKLISDETLDKILSIIAQYMEANPNKTVRLGLFGGEPLLIENEKVIDKILQFCKEHKTTVHITTNGSFLSYYLKKFIINRRFISGIYPTIDSMALNYMTRYDLDPSRNNTNETFKLLCCIKTLLHYGIHVDLGTNIDRHNHKEIWNTLDDLKKLQLLQDKNFAWTIGRVDDRLYETNFPDIMMESEILAELQSKPLPDNVHAAFLKTCYNFADKMGLKLNLREHKQTHSYCWSTSSSSNVFYVDMNLKTYLYRLFGHDKRFAVLVRAVGDWGGEGVHSLSILHQDTKDVLVAKHVAYLDKIGMSCHNHRNGALAQVCYASYPHSMVFRANGKIGKCTVALDHPQNQLGWVDPEKGIVIDPEVNCRWSFSDLKPECRSCRNVLRCMNMQCKKSEIIDGKTVCLYRKSECV